MTDKLLEMRDIRKRFGATHALRGMNLSVGAGEVLALLGENSAGKSTLVKIISAATSGPHAGRIDNRRPGTSRSSSPRSPRP